MTELEMAGPSRISVPKTPRNQSILVSIAAQDIEMQAAMITDGLAGWSATNQEGQGSEMPRAAQHEEEAMTGQVGREELDAKLEAIEARMDARVVSIGGKIDAFLAAQAERDKASEYRFQRIESDIAEIKQSIGSSFGSMKNTLIVTAISTVLAIVIGVAAFNATLTSNMLSAFQAGKAEATPPAAAPNTAPQKP